MQQLTVFGTRFIGAILSDAAIRLCKIAECKPKFQKMLAVMLRIVLNKESGPFVVNFSCGGVTDAHFNKKEV